jgi:simple sugar transport system permease protein
VGKITIRLNISVVMVVILAVVVWFFLNKTITGRNIFAIGGNYEAAKRMGINIRQNFLIAFALSGALSGIAIMQTYMKQISVTPLGMDGGHGDAMAAVIFGGTQLGNGKGGSVVGTMIGVMVITLIRTNLVMLGVPSYAQTFVVGLMLLSSVVMAAYKNFKQN